jgi:hypothetical protein
MLQVGQCAQSQPCNEMRYLHQASGTKGQDEDHMSGIHTYYNMGSNGFLRADLMTTERTLNSWHFANQIMTPLVDKIYPGGEIGWLSESMFAETIVTCSSQK